MVKIMIFDDSDDRRQSLVDLIKLNDTFTCVGAYSDCSRIQDLIRVKWPEIVLMDIRMPGIDGIEGTRLIKKIDSSIKVIIQTVFEDDDKIFQSLKAGAEGYLLKSTSAEKILQSITDVYNGGAVMTPSIALRVTKFFNKEMGGKNQEQGLTPKELEILQLLTDGLSYKMISARLGISYHTVNTHIRRIYQKLHVNSLGEAVSMALKEKLV